MPATLPDSTPASTRGRVRPYGAFSSQRSLAADAVVGAHATYGSASAHVIAFDLLGLSPVHPRPEEADLLAQVAALAGPPVAWRSDTPEEIAEQREISDALYPAQMESLARRDTQ